MKNILRALVLALLVPLATGCATPLFLKRKSQTTLRPVYLQKDLPASVSAEDAASDLTLANSSEYSEYLILRNYVHVAAKLDTPSLRKAETLQFVENQAYREKMNDEAKQSLINLKTSQIEKDAASKTCFKIDVQTDDPHANDSRSWHAVMRTPGDGDDSDLVISPFSGFKNTTTTTYVTRYSNNYSSVRSSDSSVYYLSSSICSKKPHDLSKGIDLTIQPRYKKDIREIKLKWLAPISDVQNRSQAL